MCIFPVTPGADLAYRTLQATQISLECITELEAGDCVIEGVRLTAHSGIGSGQLTAFMAGGVDGQSEYAAIGEPIFQIASAEPAAGDGETVVSGQAWDLIKSRVEGRETSGGNWLVKAIRAGEKLDLSSRTTCIVDELPQLSKEIADLGSAQIQRVVPEQVRSRLSDITTAAIAKGGAGEVLLATVSEFRNITVLFVKVSGLEFSNSGDSRLELQRLQAIVRLIQGSIVDQGGDFMRFSVDDKGAVVLGIFGLPPSHENDPERGALAAIDMCKQISAGDAFVGIRASVGITTGYAFTGLVGGTSRCEYTTHGPLVNLAARLMVASEFGPLVDEETKEACMRTSSLIEFDTKPPITVKGKVEPVPVFVPFRRGRERARRKHDGAAARTSSPRKSRYDQTSCYR